MFSELEEVLFYFIFFEQKLTKATLYAQVSSNSNKPESIAVTPKQNLRKTRPRKAQIICSIVKNKKVRSSNKYNLVYT